MKRKSATVLMVCVLLVAILSLFVGWRVSDSTGHVTAEGTFDHATIQEEEVSHTSEAVPTSLVTVAPEPTIGVTPTPQVTVPPTTAPSSQPSQTGTSLGDREKRRIVPLTGKKNPFLPLSPQRNPRRSPHPIQLRNPHRNRLQSQPKNPRRSPHQRLGRELCPPVGDHTVIMTR